jgi:hypothetical protein
MLSGSASATYHTYKLSRLPVGEPPGLAGLAVLYHYAAAIPGSDLKRTGRKRYSHAIPHCSEAAFFRSE